MAKPRLTKHKINALNASAANATNFANQNQAGFNQLGAQGNQALSGLQALANGQNSVSALQLQQAQRQNLANQQAMAASASPQNAAMAARTAAIQSGKLGYGLAGQQAVAGLQERNQAQNQYANLLGQLRGQDLSGATGSMGQAINAQSGGLNGQLDPSLVQQWTGLASAIGKMGSMGGAGGAPGAGS